ncbi:helix-turn-helix transcriptional regulator [Streptosporangium sp. NPDC023963]|uniref:helix-turn-helix domain-containing protein n=1 Tax=Streptosporangium sp. NPDC023963 TaxID=3155608 RepID=UPI003436BCFD
MAPRTTVREHNGPAMRAIRKRSELSVRELCDLLREREGVEVHPNHIRNLETNARGASPQLIGAIARVLCVPKVAILTAPEAIEREMESA